MSAISDYLEAAWLNTLRGVSFTPLASIWISLHSSAPVDETEGGWEGTELSGDGYARVEISSSELDAASPLGDGTAITNNVEVAFPMSTGVWGTISHVAFWDGASSSNLLYHGELSTARTVGASEIVTFATGNLSIGLR